MMRSRTWRPALLLLALWLGGTVAPAGAQEAPAAPAAQGEGEGSAANPAPVVLTPLQAGDLAVLEAIEVSQAEEAVRQAEAAVAQARAGKRLTADFTAVEGRMGPVQTVDFGGQSIQVGSPRITNYSLSVAQPLYTGERVERATQVAAQGVAAAQSQVQVTRHGVRQAATEAAYGVLRAQEMAGIADRQVLAVREHLRVAQAMFEAGTVAEFEVIQARTALAEAEGNQIAARTAVAQALAALRRILALPQTFPLQVVAPTDPVTRPAGDLAQLIEAAWRDRPEVAMLNARVRQAEAGVRLAEAGRNPVLALNGQATKSVATALSKGETWQITLALNKPIFDGGLTRSQTDSARSQLRSAQLALEAQRQQIALEVTQQFLTLDQVTQQLQVATQGVVEARERARVAEVRFQAGVTNGIEVLDAQTALAAAEAAQVNADYDLQLAVFRLYQALGRPLRGGE